MYKIFLVSGKVQGVCFRASTQEKALGLGLTGWARNLSDGRVEVLASGDGQQLDVLERWLQKGPPLAKVTGIEHLKIEGALNEPVIKEKEFLIL